MDSQRFSELQDVIGQFLCLNTDVGARQCQGVFRFRGYRWYVAWM